MIAFQEKYDDIYQEYLSQYASCLSSFPPDLLKQEPDILSDIITTIARKQKGDAEKRDAEKNKHLGAIKRALQELDVIEPRAYQDWKKTRTMVERLSYATNY